MKKGCEAAIEMINRQNDKGASRDDGVMVGAARPTASERRRVVVFHCHRLHLLDERRLETVMVSEADTA